MVEIKSDPYIVDRGRVLRLMLKRMPYVKFYDMMYFVNAIIELMIKRVIEDRVVIVDGFGVFSRREHKPRRLFNVNKKCFQDMVSHRINFNPHKDFLKMIEIVGKDFINELNRKKSKEEISKRTRKKVLI